MCGRVYIKSTLDELLRGFSLAEREAVLGMANQFPRYNGAPSLYYPIIIRDVVRDPDVVGPTFVSPRWGLVPAWVKEQRPGRPPPANARCELDQVRELKSGSSDKESGCRGSDGFHRFNAHNRRVHGANHLQFRLAVWFDR